MCGIFGQWNRDGAPVDLGRLERATTSLRHRGPDDEGYLLVDTRSGRSVLCGGRESAAALALPSLHAFAQEQFDLVFGFRRLAILDLSPAGHQPMSSADGRYWIIFNGEIYNYLELRRELQSFGHAFRTDTDTEVVLASYAQWGTAMTDRLCGMWGGALWDALERKLVLSRDRFGIKPLFVTQSGGSFSFGSEIKALAAAGVAELRPDRTAAGLFAALGIMPPAEEGATFFQDVQSVCPAHTTVVSAEGVTTSRYWSIPPVAGGPCDVDAQVGVYKSRFDEAMRMHLRSDVPIGTCLSGGLDSSAIVATAGRLIRELHSESVTGLVPRTFSAVYSDVGPWNERAYIDQVLARTQAKAFFVEPTAQQLVADLPALMWHQEQPFATTSIFAQWCVMRLARENGVTVLLDGQGADETLAGYHSFFGAYARQILRGEGLRAARARVEEVEAVTGATVPLGREILRALPGGDKLATWKRNRGFRAVLARSALSPSLRHEVSAGAVERMGDAPAASDLRGALIAALESGSLPHLLRYEDRNSMAFSIEARVPFLDHRLVEAVFTAPVEVRIREGWTKWVARKAMEGELPDSITWRRDKVGFATPERKWLALADMRSLLDSASSEGWFIDAVPPPEAYWRHVVIGSWLEHFIKRARIA